jgi:hypothetical protein
VADLCANCGADVTGIAEERCPSCDAAIKVVCPNCGELAPAGEEECPSCDASLAHGSAASGL